MCSLCEIQNEKKEVLFSLHINKDTIDHPLDPTAFLLQIRWIILSKLIAMLFMNVVFFVRQVSGMLVGKHFVYADGSLCVAPN